MLFSTSLYLATALLVPLVVSAAPFKRDSTDDGTATVLKFAGVLELAESKFYQEVLDKFKADDFTKAGFKSGDAVIQQLKIVQNDETIHDNSLNFQLQRFGLQPIAGCTFDFSAALTSASTVIPFARLVENVGVGAYLGSLHTIGDPHIQTEAGFISTIEARHSSTLNMFNKASIIPQPFDLPLNPPEVLAIVGGVIKGCDVGIKPNAPLTITNTAPLTPGTPITFSSPAFNSTDGKFCHTLVPGGATSIVQPLNKCLTTKINGPVLIFVTDNNTPLSGDSIDRANQTVIAGPQMAFIDTEDDKTSDIVRPKLV